MDRVESAVVVLALLAMIVAVPVAVWTAGRSHDLAAQRAAISHRITAVLLEDAPRAGVANPGDFRALDNRVRARWQAEDGTRHVGKVPARPGMRANATVPIWVDENNRPTRQPSGPEYVQATAILTGVMSYFGIGLVVLALVALIRWQLDRVRSAQWAHEWALVSPIWSRQY
ncbi:MAG: hypothetical protein GEU98_03805 [Pseudonocardiaceae bacterium]|nr:hypothetical protein [Pseudonocardiaceae bacterium]